MITDSLSRCRGLFVWTLPCSNGEFRNIRDIDRCLETPVGQTLRHPSENSQVSRIYWAFPSNSKTRCFFLYVTERPENIRSQPGTIEVPVSEILIRQTWASYIRSVRFDISEDTMPKMENVRNLLTRWQQAQFAPNGLLLRLIAGYSL